VISLGEAVGLREGETLELAVCDDETLGLTDDVAATEAEVLTLLEAETLALVVPLAVVDAVVLPLAVKLGETLVEAETDGEVEALRVTLAEALADGLAEATMIWRTCWFLESPM
jgi:hypothetical protein